MKLTGDMRELANGQLAPYGYRLDSDDQIITPKRGTSELTAHRKGPRWQVRTPSGTLVWSGPDLGRFVRDFWYAKRVEP